MKEALFYEKSENSTVHCLLCPVSCHIKNGQSGYCMVRKNKDGVLYIPYYANATAIGLDPIEKKPLYRFRPGSKILSVGGYGCNMRCPFCQNHAISLAEEPPETTFLPPDALLSLAKELIPDGNIGVAFTYNEPFIHYEYMLDCVQLLKAEGMATVVVTNGYIRKEPLQEILPYIDAMNIDLKGFTDKYYRSLKGGLPDIKETIRTSAEVCHVEVTTLIVPDQNDSLAEMDALSGWLSQTGVSALHLSRFFPRHEMLDKPETDKNLLMSLKEAANRHMPHVYVGNVY